MGCWLSFPPSQVYDHGFQFAILTSPGWVKLHFPMGFPMVFIMVFPAISLQSTLPKQAPKPWTIIRRGWESPRPGLLRKMGTTRHGHQAAKKVLKNLTGSEHEALGPGGVGQAVGPGGDGEATQLWRTGSHGFQWKWLVFTQLQAMVDLSSSFFVNVYHFGIFGTRNSHLWNIMELVGMRNIWNRPMIIKVMPHAPISWVILPSGEHTKSY